MRYAGCRIAVWILVFLLLPFTLKLRAAQGYTSDPSLDSLTVAVLSQLGIKITGNRFITTGMVDRAINQGYSEVCINFPAIEAVDTVVVTKTGEGGALPANFVAFHSVFKIAGDTLRYPMEIVDSDTLSMTVVGLEEAIQKKAQFLSPKQVFVWDTLLVTFPKYREASPNADTFVVFYYAMGETLSAGTDSCRVKPGYLNRVIYYACSRIAATRLQFELAAFYYGWYETGRPPIVGGSK